MRLLSHMLGSFLREGTLHLVDADGRTHSFGNGQPPQATIRLHDRRLHRSLFRNPELVAGEAYMDGTLTVDGGDLRSLLDVFWRNRRALRDYPLRRWMLRLGRIGRFFVTYNPVHRAQKNVAHHYDLSRQLYELFLDEDMQYSCAYFRTPADSLDLAQQQKRAHIAAKLCLRPGQKVLDIGCGWGGMAMTLAELADVEVLGITLSREQHAVATERARARGLSDRVRFELRDYRDVQGRFDRIVSIGMFEHVGALHYDAYFSALHDLLTEDGVALVHSIGHMGTPGATNAWIRKYIFPGGHIPTLSEVVPAVERHALWIADLEVLRLHYAETLRHWHERFQAHRDAIRTLYDERFCRMWEFYLLNCEYTFRFGGEMVFQMQLARQRHAVPLTRDYLGPVEEGYTARIAAAAARTGQGGGLAAVRAAGD